MKIKRLFASFLLNTKWRMLGAKIQLSSLVCAPSHFKNPKYVIIGKNTTIRRDAIIHNLPRFKFIVGDNVLIGEHFLALVYQDLNIGKNTIIAPYVKVISVNHGLDPTLPSYADTPDVPGKVTIGEGVWIGTNVTILPNVVIGDKAVIGAGSVVTHSIPSYSIAVGSPAKVIKKYNFEKKQWDKI